jgi:hypothetical protein
MAADLPDLVKGDDDEFDSVFMSRCSLRCDFCGLWVYQAVHSCEVGVNMDPTCINICLPCLARLQGLAAGNPEPGGSLDRQQSPGDRGSNQR